MPSPRRAKQAPPTHARADAEALFQRGIADLTAAHQLAIGAPPQLHLALLEPPRQAELALEPIVISSPTAAERPVPIISNASRQHPYQCDDGRVMIKQSFRATEGFDTLWRKLDGALPRHVSKNKWIEDVLTRAILEQMKADG